MDKIILFITIFLIVYLFYLVFVISRKKSLNKWKNGKEMTYLKYRYKLNLDKINIKVLGHVIGISNAIIMASTFTICVSFKKYYIGIIMSFIILFPLILIIYHIIGKYYQKKLRRVK